jgi:pentatricopeptide repeat protein
VEQVYHDMVEAGVEPDVYTFNTLINACAQRGDAERARDVFDEMKRTGVVADVFSYNTMILAFEQAGDWRAAIKVGSTLCLMEHRPCQGWDDLQRLRIHVACGIACFLRSLTTYN